MERDASRLFALDAGPYRDGVLRVVSFRGREAMSRPYRWDVLVDVEGVDFDALEVDLLAQPASLDYTGPLAAPRVVHGVVSALRRVDVSRDGLTRRVRLRLVPRLALLSRSRMSRVFQDMTVPEIVGEVLAEAGVTVALKLQQRHQARVYCVQYQESDLAFVTRLLAEEGIFYYFLQPPVMPSGGDAAGALRDFLAGVGIAAADVAEVVVLADHPSAYPPIAPRHDATEGVDPRRAPTLVLHRGDGDVPEEHHVARLTRERAVRPQATLLRGYDFRHPRVDLSAAQSAREVAAPRVGEGFELDFDDVLAHRLQRTAARSTEVAPVSLDPRRATVYAHHGEDDDPEVTRAAAKVRFDQERRRVVHASGGGWCRRLSAGHRFRLDGHDDASLNEEYVATEVRHVGRTGDPTRRGAARAAYQSAFACVPAWVAWRPAAPPQVHRQVLETARVVGPPGEEIYTDAHGRVKVQFHWDLAGRNDERSSCWLRVGQAWAGAHWGAQFVPRVGMEVIVSFLGGDQDRPVVLGCLYNGENTAPFVLPGDRTRSGVRTQSSPGGGGHNELSFEDAKGTEQVYLRAERDLAVEVKNSQRVNVEQFRTIVVGSDRSETVAGNATQVVSRRHVVRVGGDDLREVGGAAKSSVAGAFDARVDGEASVGVGGDVTVALDGDCTVRVGVTRAPPDPQTERDADLQVSGALRAIVGDEIVLQAQRMIVLQCGRSRLELTPEGVTVKADQVVSHGVEGATLRTDDAVLFLNEEIRGDADAVRFFGPSAKLEIEREATLKGSKVHLGQGGARKKYEPRREKTEAVFRFRVRGSKEAVADLKARIRHPDGTIVEHEVGPDGCIRIPTTERTDLFELVQVVDPRSRTLTRGKRLRTKA